MVLDIRDLDSDLINLEIGIDVSASMAGLNENTAPGLGLGLRPSV
jgi:hypothetical protein